MTVTTEHYYTGNASTTSFAYTFPYYQTSDIKVTWDGVLKTEGTHYDITGTNVVFKTSPTDYTPGNGVSIHIYRQTNVDTSKATFAAGSSITSTDLNNNELQLLYSAQEEQGQLIKTAEIKDGQITSAKILDGTIATADVADGAITNAKIATNSIAADRLANNAVGTDEIADNAVTMAKLASGTLPTDVSIPSASLSTGIIVADKIATDAVTTVKILDNNVTTAKIANSNVTTAKIADLNITTDKIANLNVTEAKIANGAITGGKLGNAAVDTTQLANNAVTSAKIAAGTIETDDIGDGQITNAKIADTTIESGKLANNSVIAAKISSGSITTDKIANSNVTTAKIADDAITTAKIADAELSTLAGMQSGTASVLASGTTLTSSLAELNLLDGKSISTSVSGSSTDSQLPTAKAVNDQIVSLMQDAGGFYPIDDELKFPNANPDPNDDAGTIVSIADAGGIVVNSSGVSTTGRTLGGATVTINGIDSSLHDSTIAAGKGMLVQTTSTLNTYTYHRLFVDEAGVANAQSLVSDFNNRYRIGSSNPTTSLDDGDLFFNTTSNKMLVYNATGSSWDEVQSVGNFYINTISSYSGTGGNSATFNGSAYRFVLSNPGTVAQQHIVSINGVLQKPNSGTSQPSEGFAIDGSSIILSAAPASGSDYFIITVGASVNIGAPTDDTVSTASIQNSAVTTAKLGSDAVTGAKIADDAIDSEHYTDGSIDTAHIAADAVTGAKIADDAIDSEHYTDGSIDTAHIAADAVTGAKIADDAVGAEHIEQLDANVSFADSAKLLFGAGNDLEIYHDGSQSTIKDTGTGHLVLQSDGEVQINPASGGEYGARIITDGAVELYHNNEKKIETKTNGAIVQDLTASGAYLDIKGSDGVNGKVYGVSGTTVGFLDDQNHWLVKGVKDGSTELYYDNSKKFETTTNGCTVTGTATVGTLSLADNNYITAGTGEDLKIYHDGTNSYVDNEQGSLILKSDAGGFIYLQATHIFIESEDGEKQADFISDGAVELYHNNLKKFETTSNGVMAQNGAAAEVYIGMNDSGGSTGYIKGSGETLGFVDDQGHWTMAGTKDGSVDLYFNNTKVFETISWGVQIAGGKTTGDFIFDNGTNAGRDITWDESDDALEFADNTKALFGTGGDLSIYHDGSNSYLAHESGTGDLILNTDSTCRINPNGGGEYGLAVHTNGGVELYHDNELRLSTDSTGVKVERNENEKDVYVIINNNHNSSGSDAVLRLKVTSSDSNSKIQFGDDADVDVGQISYDHTANDFTFKIDGSAHYEMDTGAFHPTTDDADDCGRSNNRWDDIRATNGSIQTSDRNEKNTIVASDLGLDFVNKLTPVSYKFNNKTRTHYGLIAQDVETLLSDISKTATDFAGFCKDRITIKTELDEDGNSQEIPLETPFDRYGLRYNEFIAPMIKAIQELSEKVAALEAK